MVRIKPGEKKKTFHVGNRNEKNKTKLHYRKKLIQYPNQIVNYP